MAKPAPYTLRWSPSRQIYELIDRENTTVLDLPTERLAWLQEVPSFAFDGQLGAYTARQETKQRGESYWYAYRKREGKLTKKYLGKATELTLARLEEVAHLLSAESAAQASVSEATLAPSSTEAHAVSDAQEGKMRGDAEPHTPPSPLLGWEPDPLLATKLQRPRLRPHLVHRSPLTQRLTQALAGALTLVCAPAGYGKTTLLGDWLASSGTQAAWLSLDPEDNDPARFWSYVIAALETLHPDIGAEARAMLQSGLPMSFMPLLTRLMNHLNQITDDFVLVLEDYHVVTEAAIHEALSFLVDHLPNTTHLVVTSRTTPPLHLARLRARCQLLELQTEDLRFTLEESAAFFSEVMELPLSRDDLQKVEARTEGWIAGLQLAALSMQGHSDISDCVARFAGTNRSIFDYLLEEVLWRQPALLQEFLLHTCVLEQLTGSLCDAVTGRRDSSVILAQLEAAQLFIMPLDDQRRWYRYHSLFADALRSYVAQTAPALADRLHRTASSWYEEHGRLADALSHALKAADYEQAVVLIEQLAPELLARGEVRTFFEWLESLPASYVITRSCLCLYGAWGYLVSGNLDDAQTMLDQARRIGIEPSMRTAAAAIQIAFAPYHGNASDAALLAHEVISEYETLSTPFKRRSLFALQGAVVALKTQGRLRDAATICRQVLSATRGVPLDTWTAASRTASAFLLSDILYEFNDLVEAWRLAKEAIELCEKAPNDEVKAYSYAVLARIRQAKSDTAATLSLIQTAETVIRKRGIAHEIAFLTSWQARIWLAQKRHPDAFKWAEANAQYMQVEPNYLREHVFMTLARVSLAQGHIAHVLQLLSQMQEMAQADGRIRTVVEVLALRALAYQSQDDDVTALAELKQALMYAGPEGYVRLFVDEGKPMAQLLVRLLAAERSDAQQSLPLTEYITTLLAAFGDAAMTSINIASPSHTGPLTNREIEVLRLLATGASNREMANQLVIALGTVKKHMNNICVKLRASNRVQAIARAQALRLL